MYEKTIDELIPDIEALFQSGHECNPRNLDSFAASLSKVVGARLAESRADDKDYLRMSNLGKPDRRLWYDLVDEEAEQEELPANTRFKFLFGDILEALLIFLAREAGHTVEQEQAEVELDGVVGHVDAVIDGVLVDVKSASTYSFKKFKTGDLRDNDPFGYMDQLAGYSTALGNLDGAFLAVDKTLGNLTLMKVDQDELASLDSRSRIEHIRSVLDSPDIPGRCYPEEAFGQSGNMKLGVNCSYCPHKFRCWSDANDGIGLRTFLYSGGPVHLTKVVNEPKVMEVTF